MGRGVWGGDLKGIRAWELNDELSQPGSHGSCIHFVLLWVRWRSWEDKGHVPLGCAVHLLKEQELFVIGFDRSEQVQGFPFQL